MGKVTMCECYRNNANSSTAVDIVVLRIPPRRRSPLAVAVVDQRRASMRTLPVAAKDEKLALSRCIEMRRAYGEDVLPGDLVRLLWVHLRTDFSFRR